MFVFDFSFFMRQRSSNSMQIAIWHIGTHSLKVGPNLILSHYFFAKTISQRNFTVILMALSFALSRGQQKQWENPPPSMDYEFFFLQLSPAIQPKRIIKPTPEGGSVDASERLNGKFGFSSIINNSGGMADSFVSRALTFPSLAQTSELEMYYLRYTFPTFSPPRWDRLERTSWRGWPSIFHFHHLNKSHISSAYPL